MDAWDEHFDMAKWTAAFEQTGIDPAAIAHRELPLDAPLPWSHIRCPRTEDYLCREYARAMEVGSTGL